MSYVVLARKYRPQSFEDVVGQLPVSQTLVNALESARVAHAYIFSGPRGVGKTTTARILAKCLNCEKGPTTKPCNKCDSCQMISQGTSMNDVLEIDGASNRGIEQIRELRETAKYAPTASRYRIFIIDEAHQITKDAFGALLKILEEPPPHVIFMMATTEAQKIPAPILSRCQRFSLRPISPDLVLKHLKSICAQEKIKVEDAALADIVRFVEGSLRDALSLLDQALVFSPDKITSNTLRDLLGLLPAAVIRELAECAKAGEPAAILKKVNEFLQDGIDLTQLGKDLQAYYHTLLLEKAGVEDPLRAGNKELKAEAAGYDFQTLERNIRLLSRALDDMRHSETPRAVFEVYALKLGQKTLDPRNLIERLEKLEKNVPASAPAFSPAPARPAFTPPQPKFSPQPSPTIAAPTTPSTPPLPSPPRPAGRGPEVSNVEIQARWNEFVTFVEQHKQTLAAALSEAAPARSGEVLIITFQKSFSMQMAQKSNDLLKNLIAEFFGGAVSFEFRLSDAPAKPAEAAAAKSSLHHPAPAPANDDEPAAFEEVNPSDANSDVQKALKHFSGTLKRERKNP